jgi:hypothetical protein
MFSSDAFSLSNPIWKQLSNNNTINIFEILDLAHFDISNILNKDIKVEYSGSFEINSNNYRLHCGEGIYLLKKWSTGKSSLELNNILDLMTYFSLNHLPVPMPFCNELGKKLFLIQDNYWSIFPFVNGDYFSGIENQIQIASKISGKLYCKGLNLPDELVPDIGPEHLSDLDNSLLLNINSQKKNWNHIFGEEHSSLLFENWNLILNSWNKLRNEELFLGNKIPIHFDLHPHNLLFKKSEIAAILDFESFKLFPLGVAMAFNGLKQCRQYISLNGYEDELLIRRVGNKYIDDLISEFPSALEFRDDFCNLAQVEVLRRICNILRLNFEGNSKLWNHVLPIQINHLKEVKVLFS